MIYIYIYSVSYFYVSNPVAAVQVGVVCDDEWRHPERITQKVTRAT